MTEVATTHISIERALQDWSEPAAAETEPCCSSAPSVSLDHLPLDSHLPPSSPPSRPRPRKSSSAPGRRIPFQRFDPRSINGLLQQHSRQRLYVHPLRWTSQQLLLLDCRFVANLDIRKAVEKAIQKSKEKKTAPVPHATDNQIGSQTPVGPTADAEAIDQGVTTWTMIRETLRWLNYGSTADIMARNVRDLLVHQGFSRVNLPLYLRFGGRKIKQLRPSATFAAPRFTSPNVAYVNLETQFYFRRWHLVRPDYRRLRHHEPIKWVQSREWYQFKSRNLKEDPYMVALLIALAQAQRRETFLNVDMPPSQTPPSAASISPDSQSSQDDASPSPTGPSPTTDKSSFKVHVLALAEECLYLYTANIPTSFLDRLDYPSRYFPGEPLDVSYFEIPFRGVTRIRLMRRALSMMCEK